MSGVSRARYHDLGARNVTRSSRLLVSLSSYFAGQSRYLSDR